MKAIFAALIVGILLAGASDVHAEEPADCAPKQRTVQGNASSPCLWDYHLDEITSMPYVVVEHPDTNTCYEALEFSPFNFERDFGPGVHLSSTRALPDGRPNGDRYQRGNVDAAPLDRDYDRHFIATGTEQVLLVRHAVPVRRGPYSEWSNERRISPFYGLEAEVGTASKFIYDDSLFGSGPFFKLITPKTKGSQQTQWFRIPVEVNDFNSMMNDCIHGIRIRLETEATQETIRQQLAAEELQKQQALAAEKAQADLDAMRLESARAQLLVVQEQELIKTRALKDRLERDRVIVGLIQGIALERIRGAEERAGITHTYLEEIEANYASFDAEVQARYDELQRLEALNQTIAEAIAAHETAIQANLERAETLEEQNRQKLDELIGAEPPPVPELATRETLAADEIGKLASLVEQGLLTQEQFDLLTRQLLPDDSDG